MRTTVEPLEGNRIKLSVEVDGEEVAAAERETLNRLSKQARIPGFRPGKVPRRLLEARLGQRAIREEALRDVLPRFYGDAVRESELDVIATPQIDITAGEESGPVSFDAVVEVRPEVAIPGYQGLAITVPNPTATDEEVDAQIDRMREQFATLTEVSRPAKSGDVVTLDVHGSRDGKPADGLVADDLVYELGTGGIANGVDAEVIAAKVGDIFEMDADDTPGGPAHLRILVKLVREKVLPAVDDAFVQDASEFETLKELRDDLHVRLGELKRRQAAGLLQTRSLDALGDLVAEDPPTTLIANEAQRLLDDFVKRLAQQQIPLDAYLDATGTEREAFFTEFENQARRDVRADLALRALAGAEEIEVDESEVDEEIVHLADHASTTPDKMRSTIERGAGLAGLRSQIKRAKALRWLIEHVAIVDEEGKPVDRSMLLEGEAQARHAHDDLPADRSDTAEESK